MGSTAAGLAIGLIIALNLYALEQHDHVPSQIMLPCPDQTCNFQGLLPFMDSDTVHFLEFMWTTRLRNLDLNVTDVYFCGENYTVQFDHCNLTRYYAIVGFLIGSLFLTAIYGCVSRFVTVGRRAPPPSSPEPKVDLNLDVDPPMYKEN